MKLRDMLIIVISSFFFLNGCAFVDQKVQLTYDEQDIAKGGKGDLYLEKPQDSTNLIKNEDGYIIIGTVKNSYSMKTADCVTNDNIGDWIANSLMIELKNAGYDVYPVKHLNQNLSKGISIRILKVWVDQDTGFLTVGAISTIIYIVDVYKNGTQLASLYIEATGDKRSAFGTAATKGISLKKALMSSTKKAVPEIIEILEK